MNRLRQAFWGAASPMVSGGCVLAWRRIESLDAQNVIQNAERLVLHVGGWDENSSSPPHEFSVSAS